MGAVEVGTREGGDVGSLTGVEDGALDGVFVGARDGDVLGMAVAAFVKGQKALGGPPE